MVGMRVHGCPHAEDRSDPFPCMLSVSGMVPQNGCQKDRAWPPGGFTFVELLVVMTIIGILIAMLLPAIQAARETSRRLQCVNHQKQIALGLHNYAAEHMEWLPYAGLTLTGNGHAFSWLVRLFPYLEQMTLYDMVKSNDWWQVGVVQPGTTYYTIRMAKLPLLHCPSDRADQVDDPNGNPHRMGNYVGNMGNTDFGHHSSGLADGTTLAYRGAPFGVGDPYATGGYRPFIASLEDCHDGASNTLAVSELVVPSTPKTGWQGYVGRNLAMGGSGFTAKFPPNSGIDYGARQCWSSIDIAGASCTPIDGGNASYYNVSKAMHTVRSRHPGGVVAAMLDGSVRFISDSIALEVWQAAATTGGGELLQFP